MYRYHVRWGMYGLNRPPAVLAVDASSPARAREAVIEHLKEGSLYAPLNPMVYLHEPELITDENSL